MVEACSGHAGMLRWVRHEVAGMLRWVRHEVGGA